MTEPTLRIFEFDGSIAHMPTWNQTSFYNAENNTKEGIASLVKHNDNFITAVVAVTDAPDYVLSYLLPLLNATTEDIDHTESEEVGLYTYKNYYLKNIKNPIIIAYTLDHLYKTNGNNAALKYLASLFPQCRDYQYYDNDSINIAKTLKLPYFTSNLLKPNAALKIISSTKPIRVENDALIRDLVKYIGSRIQNKHAYSGWGSFFSCHLFGYSKKEKIDAASALIVALQRDEPLDAEHLAALREGTLGKTIKKHLGEKSTTLENLVTIAETPVYD